jgi:hypothetical protein
MVQDRISSIKASGFLPFREFSLGIIMSIAFVGEIGGVVTLSFLIGFLGFQKFSWDGKDF